MIKNMLPMPEKEYESWSVLLKTNLGEHYFLKDLAGKGIDDIFKNIWIAYKFIEL